MAAQELNFGDTSKDPQDLASADNSTNDTLEPGNKAGSKTAGDEPDFERSLKRLEAIVQEMENGDLNLQDCMARFEEGTKLSNFCAERLEETEKKIEILTKDGNAEGTWKKFETESEDETVEF